VNDRDCPRSHLRAFIERRCPLGRRYHLNLAARFGVPTLQVCAAASERAPVDDALHCSGTTIICKDPERVVGTGRPVSASTLGTEARKHTCFAAFARFLCTMRLHAMRVRQESKDAGGDPPATYPHLSPRGTNTGARTPSPTCISRPILRPVLLVQADRPARTPAYRADDCPN
jgi:hypothetical protein